MARRRRRSEPDWDENEEQDMPSERREERDLILNPRQYALVMDNTKGQIVCYVGPHKVSLADTDRPVTFEESGDFRECQLSQAIQAFRSADEGSYLVLQNPAVGDQPHPALGNANTMAKLEEGRKINIPGPVTFPLWPGQSALAVPGHQLRSNEYLVCRVYNAEAAKVFWGEAVVQPVVQTPPVTDPDPDKKSGDGDPADAAQKAEGVQQPPQPPSEGPSGDLFGINPDDLTMGQLLVINGEAVSFYIPATGIEVMPDDDGKHVRQAVTVERLEYCILQDEDGNKRFVRGPAVVFPKPTERFVQRRDETKRGKRTRRFRAIELNEISGIYVKVIDPYTERDPRTREARSYKEGEELFITGKDQAIYFPRPEHAVLRYGNQEVHYAVAIPAGEARYVMERLTGKIRTLPGPEMLLPDPRRQVIIRRIISLDAIKLWYPGNQEAVDYNAGLMQAQAEEQTSGSFVTERQYRKRGGGAQMAAMNVIASADVSSRGMMARSYDAAFEEPEAEEALMPDAMDRKTEHTKPRTIVLNTKYEGAPSVSVWTGYAVLVVSKTGNRRVVVGPETVILNYDETLEVLGLSRGKPKTTDQILRTVYLRVTNNKVSDVVSAETKDLVEVGVKLSYRVNFEGEDREKWFSVENYVKFLTDHLRSLLRNAIKKVSVEEFNDSATDLIRDTILGKGSEDGERSGRGFDENNMRVYDVEVLEVGIGDQTIAGLLKGTQHSVVQKTLELKQREHELEMVRRNEKISQSMETARQETALHMNKLAEESEDSKLLVRIAQIATIYHAQKAELEAKMETQEGQDEITAAELAREKTKIDHRLGAAKGDQDLKLVMLKAEHEARIEQIKAIEPSLAEAINRLGDQEFFKELMEALGPHALLQGDSVQGVLSKLIAGSPGLGEKIVSLAQGLLTNKDAGNQVASAD